MKADEKSCEIPGRPTDTDLKQDEFIPVWPQGDGKAFAGKAFPVNAGLKNIDGIDKIVGYLVRESEISLIIVAEESIIQMQCMI